MIARSTLALAFALAGCAKSPAPTPAKPSSPVERAAPDATLDGCNDASPWTLCAKEFSHNIDLHLKATVGRAVTHCQTAHVSCGEGKICAVLKTECDPRPIKPKAAQRVRSIQFAFDSDTVSKRDASRILKDCLHYPGPKVLTGYASSERSGKYKETASKAYNLALAARRAQAVRLVYTVSGCPDVQVDAFGETAKFNKKRPEINRRVAVR